jgi:hypothetical protein
MDERDLELLRQVMRDVEGAPSPGLFGDELYGGWHEHAQAPAQEALQYQNAMNPEYGQEGFAPSEQL